MSSYLWETGLKWIKKVPRGACSKISEISSEIRFPQNQLKKIHKKKGEEVGEGAGAGFLENWRRWQKKIRTVFLYNRLILDVQINQDKLPKILE